MRRRYGKSPSRTHEVQTVSPGDEVAGIDRERVLGVDRHKVDDALVVTELAERDVYEIDESEYVRKPRSTRNGRKVGCRGSRINSLLPKARRPRSYRRRSRHSEITSKG
jgi:hypothetical protein